MHGSALLREGRARRAALVRRARRRRRVRAVSVIICAGCVVLLHSADPSDQAQALLNAGFAALHAPAT